MPAKVDKGYAGYRRADGEDETCHNCRSMNDDGTCQKVEGKVEPNYVCDLWSAKRAPRPA